jgi:N-acetylmuramoyl-L-alanine amidase-like protein
MKMQPIASDCRTTYVRKPLDGYRSVEEIIWIVVHDTEGGTAEIVARYFQTNRSGYTHLVVDDAECQRCLRDVAIPRGAVGANERGFHIEQCGHAAWKPWMWRKHLRTIRRAAYKSALHCYKFRIAPRWITAADLSIGRAGITSHAECSEAFGGTHTDPGLGWPRGTFMQFVRGYYKQISQARDT